MANYFKSSKVYPISADGLLEVMTSEEYQVGNMQSQPQNKEGKFTEISRDDKKMVFRMDTVEYAKKIPSGALDMNKTENTYTITTWDLVKRKAEWEYNGPQKQAKVWGTIEIEPAGDEARMTNIFNVDISVPVIGGKIEKKVVSEVEKHWPNYEAKVMEYINKK